MSLGQWIGFLALAVSLYILWQIRQVLLLVFAAVVLANSLNLLSQRFQALGLRRSGAVLLSVASFLAALIAFFFLIVPPFASQFQDLVVLVPASFDRLDAWTNNLVHFVPPSVIPYLPSLDSLNAQIQPYINRLLGGSFAFFSSSLGVVVNILLVLILGLMLLINPLAYRRGFIRLFPAFYRYRVDRILRECEISLGRWIVGALISMSVVAILSSIGLALLGVKAAMAQGILAGLLNFIPNIGPTLSVVLPMATALLDSPLKSLFVFVLYVAIQQFESNLLTPYVMAQQVALLPAATLLAQVFFATIFGFLGLALALPLTVVTQIWIRRVFIEDVMDRWGVLHPKHLTHSLPAATLSGQPSASSDLPSSAAGSTVPDEPDVPPRPLPTEAKTEPADDSSIGPSIGEDE
ncbi:MAG: AI-2E family transporter [Stenomitos rutilans HA7619-LM2]|nr:AI-2E family transporter [Stenomitos rutilans HA7619-LM2]